MFWSRKYGARRTEVRKNRPDLGSGLYLELKAKGVFGSIGVALAFWLVASAIMMLREEAERCTSDRSEAACITVQQEGS